MKLKHNKDDRTCPEGERIPKDPPAALRDKLFMLSGQDRIIMSMYLEYGISYNQIAILTGVTPSCVLRRIRRISKAMRVYILCLKNQEQFTTDEMSIARDYFVRGLSIRQIAHRKDTSYYRIREKLMEIEQAANNFRKEVI